MENNKISVECLINLLEPKQLDFENIGRSLAEKENKWYSILDEVKTKEIGLKLLDNLQYANGYFKNEDYFKYVDRRVRKQEYEVIKALISITTEDSADKSEKDDMLYKYIEKEIRFQNLGFKKFPMPILPQYENITDKNIIDMLKIIGLENEINFNNAGI